jgi:hypothetical protein
MSANKSAKKKSPTRQNDISGGSFHMGGMIPRDDVNKSYISDI